MDIDVALSNVEKAEQAFYAMNGLPNKNGDKIEIQSDDVSTIQTEPSVDNNVISVEDIPF